MTHATAAIRYKPFTDDQRARCAHLYALGETLALQLETMCPDTAERALAIRKIHEAIMWATAAMSQEEAT